MSIAANAPTFEQLHALAKKVARWASQEASDQQDVANFDVDPYDLTGMCAIAAARTHALLAQGGLHRAKIALSSRWMECHAFVLIDGWVVDPTAMQFGNAECMVLPHASKRGPWYYRRPQTFATVQAFCSHLDATTWFWGQHPDRSLDRAGRPLPKKSAQELASSVANQMVIAVADASGDCSTPSMSLTDRAMV